MSETTTKATRRQRQTLAEIDVLLQVKRKREAKRDAPPIYDHGAVSRGVRSVNDVSRRIGRLIGLLPVYLQPQQKATGAP